MLGAAEDRAADAPWTLLEAAPDAILVVGDSGRIEFVNAQTERIFGYPRAELLGQPLELLLPERYRERHGQHMARFLGAPRVRPMGEGLELHGRHRSGQEFPVEIALSPIEMGGKRLVIAALRDITARKLIEEELGRSREDLQITLESIGDGVIVSSLEGRVTRMNPAAQRLTGWSAEEALGQPLERVFTISDEATGAKIELPVRGVLREGSSVSRDRLLLRSRSGEERPVAASGAPVRDSGGRLRGVVLVLRDQTEEAAARRQLRRSEEMFRGLLDNLPDFVLTLDAGGHIQFVNRDHPPHTRDGLVGQSWLALAAPDQHQLMSSALERVLKTGEPASYEVTSVAPDGSLGWSAHHLGPLRQEGALVGAVLVARDISERRRIEAQLAASERMASMGLLAAGIAHEINNPLAVVLANLELASSELSARAQQHGVTQAVREELCDAAQAAARVRDIVRDLRIFSRAESDQLTTIDVRPVLESILRMAWNEIRHRARLVRDYRDVPPVKANEARLGQLFLNLILNAAQAIPEGHAEDNEIRVCTRPDDRGNVCVEVGDTGSGMAPEVQRRAFDPFFTTKPPGVGTGLGLAICTRIVNGLGGSIEVESRPGLGSLFRVRLPALEASTTAGSQAPQREAPQREAPQLAAPEPPAPRRGRVLVIDDEELLGSSIGRALAPLHDVVVVQRARDALERLEAGEAFDVILCDLMMPELSGRDFYRRLQRRVPLACEKVVFLTGGAFGSETREFLETSPDLVRLEKPFDVAALRALVNERVPTAPATV